MNQSFYYGIQLLLLMAVFSLSVSTVHSLTCAPLQTYIGEVDHLNTSHVALKNVSYEQLDARQKGSLNISYYDEAIKDYRKDIQNDTRSDLDNKTYQRNSSGGSATIERLQQLNVRSEDIIAYGSPHGPCGTGLFLIYSASGRLKHGYIPDGFMTYTYDDIVITSSPGAKINCSGRRHYCDVYTDIDFEGYSLSIAEGEYATFNETSIRSIMIDTSQYYERDPPVIHDWGTGVKSHMYIDFHNKTLNMNDVGKNVAEYEIIESDQTRRSPWQWITTFITNILR